MTNMDAASSREVDHAAESDEAAIGHLMQIVRKALAFARQHKPTQPS